MNGVLLDTNTLSDFVDPASAQHGAISARLASSGLSAFMSVLTAFELTLLGRVFAPSKAAIDDLIRELPAVAVPTDAAGIFADLKVALAKARGVKLHVLAKHNVDVIIAATAIAEDLAVVSNDSIFRDIAAIDPRLTVEDWTQA